MRKGLFWAAAVFAFVMGVIPHPPELPGSPSDKVQHAIAFVVLGLLGDRAYRKTAVWKLLVGLSLFGAFIEVVQAIPMLHRDSDPLDWLTDTVACGVALFALRWWHRRRT